MLLCRMVSLISALITVLSDNMSRLHMRTLPTSEDHGFGRFKPWKRFHWLLLEVQCVANLGLLHILHPCYYVAHLACKPAKQSKYDYSYASKYKGRFLVCENLLGVLF